MTITNLELIGTRLIHYSSESLKSTKDQTQVKNYLKALYDGYQSKLEYAAIENVGIRSNLYARALLISYLENDGLDGSVSLHSFNAEQTAQINTKSQNLTQGL